MQYGLAGLLKLKTRSCLFFGFVWIKHLLVERFS
jgi:hypothetical protein